MDTEQNSQKSSTFQIDIIWAPYGTKKDGSCNTPNPTQKKVLQWVDKIRHSKHSDKEDHIPVLLLQGGVGSGKSRALLAPVGEMLMEIPGLRVLWGRQDFNDIKLSIMDKFFQLIPPEVVVNKNEQYHWYDIQTIHGEPSRIFFNGLKDLSGLGSQEFGVIVITEVHEISEQAYRTLKRRCRQENVPVMILMEGEPPNEGHWLTRLTDPKSEDYDKDIDKWELSTYENWDNLPVAYRGSLESMPEAWKRKYLHGKAGFIPKGKPFYQGFREDLHTGWFEWNPHEKLILAFDFGFHRPAVSFHQINQRWYVLRELMGENITIRKFCQEVKSFINTNFPNAMIECYGDPAGLQNNDKSEKTSIQICEEEGFHIKCKSSTYRQRKEIIDSKMSVINNGKPILQVDQRCKTIIEGFLGGYHYAEDKNSGQVTSNWELPVHDDFYSHLMNTVEYVSVNVFKPIQKNTDKNRKYLYRSAGKKFDNAGFGFGKK